MEVLFFFCTERSRRATSCGIDRIWLKSSIACATCADSLLRLTLINVNRRSRILVAVLSLAWIFVITCYDSILLEVFVHFLILFQSVLNFVLLTFVFNFLIAAVFEAIGRVLQQFTGCFQSLFRFCGSVLEVLHGVLATLGCLLFVTAAPLQGCAESNEHYSQRSLDELHQRTVSPRPAVQ